MKKLFRYLEEIPMSKRWVLAIIAISIAVVPTLINLLFTSETLRTLLDEQLNFVLMGMAVYCSWLTLLYLLTRKDRVGLKHLSLTRAAITKGLIIGIGLFAAVNAALLLKSLIFEDSIALSRRFSSLEGASAALGVFTFNIFLGAFAEEILCRVYLIPQCFLLLGRKIKHKATALLLSLVLSQLLFAAAHLPRDLFRFDVSAATIISTQAQLFMSGIILSLVYLRTRNVVFLGLFHAFMNYGLPITGMDADFKLYYMVAAFAIAVFWGKILKTDRTAEALSPDLLAVK
ncbi:hypothetical protein D770_09015 [Flammeovirgaceae bacterium 311]|nr:hypothetical protein D770_09015 [Flammeovirgaceae bacterium 311]